MARIELLYWEGCPSYPEAQALLEQVVAEHGLDVEVEVREVKTDAEAADLSFPGSPTIRVDGRDIQPPVDPEPPGLTCRIYHLRDGRVSPLPDPADLKEALAA
jgi:hypothetical protein